MLWRRRGRCEGEEREKRFEGGDRNCLVKQFDFEIVIL